MPVWRECQPGFFLPQSIDCSAFPPYDDLIARGLDSPEFEDMLRFGDLLGPPPRFAWAAWFAAQKADREPKLDPGLRDSIARRVYESQRYKALVPAWRRWLTEVVTEIDDIEDQVSTIVWLAEILSKRVPLFRKVPLGLADRTAELLDSAGKILTGNAPNRALKAEWRNRHREALERRRAARGRLAKLLAWFRENWGRLLEAGQATGTWFDVGIVLGPIMGWIDEAYFATLQQSQLDEMVLGAILLPGTEHDPRTDLSGLRQWLDANLFDALDRVDWDQIENDPFEF